MTHKEINIAKTAGHKLTYARVVVDHQPQKEDPNRIRIAVGGNLITYKGSTSTRTANLTTSKLLWNRKTTFKQYFLIAIKILPVSLKSIYEMKWFCIPCYYVLMFFEIII